MGLELPEKQQPPYPFLENSEQLRREEEHYSKEISEREIKKNPKYWNPLGVPVSKVALFFLGDTHYPLADAKKDPTTFLRNSIAYFFSQELPAFIKQFPTLHPKTAYEHVRPGLFETALHALPNSLEGTLEEHQQMKDKDILIIHTGDIAANGAQEGDLSYATKMTQSIMEKIGEKFQTVERIAQRFKTVLIQVAGDHDVDQRPWREEENTKQASWFYKTFGPSFFYQEIRAEDSDETKKAVLGIDTNLLDKKWQRGIYKGSKRALQELSILTGITFGDVKFLSLETMELIYNTCQTNRREDLYEAILLYFKVQEYVQTQEELIEEARDLDELILCGHHPRYVRKIARRLNAKKTIVITGHRHFPSDSDTIKIRPKPKNKSGSPIRKLGLGAPTAGYWGFEINSMAQSCLMNVDTQNPTEQVYTIAHT